MNERLEMIPITLVDPTEGNSIGNLHYYFDAIVGFTIVGLSVAPEKDDSGATLDVDDDGSNVITAVDASDADVPGTWKSTHLGGTNDPVKVASGSKVSFDINSGAAATAYLVILFVLMDELQF